MENSGINRSRQKSTIKLHLSLMCNYQPQTHAQSCLVCTSILSFFLPVLIWRQTVIVQFCSGIFQCMYLVPPPHVLFTPLWFSLSLSTKRMAFGITFNPYFLGLQLPNMGVWAGDHSYTVAPSWETKPTLFTHGVPCGLNKRVCNKLLCRQSAQ